MKRNFIVVSCLFLLFISVMISGCNENPIGFQAQENSESGNLTFDQPTDENENISDRQGRGRMQKNILYVSFGNDIYQQGAVFYKDDSGQLRTDISPIEIIQLRESRDSIRIKFRYLGYIINMTAYNTSFKSNVPERDSIHAFNGLGIVEDRQLAYLYSEQRNRIKVFDRSNYSNKTYEARRNGNIVNIRNGHQIRPHELVPDPWQNNIHKYFDGQVEYYSYLPNFHNF